MSNVISAPVHGSVLQIGVVQGDVHVHPPEPEPEPKVRVQLLAGLRRGGDYGVGRLDGGAASMRPVTPLEFARFEVARALVIQVFSESSGEVSIDQLGVEFAPPVRTGSAFPVPGRGPAAVRLPYRMLGSRSQHWPVELAGLDQHIALVTGSLPGADLAVHARKVIVTGQIVSGDWRPHGAIPPVPRAAG